MPRRYSHAWRERERVELEVVCESVGLWRERGRGEGVAGDFWKPVEKLDVAGEEFLEVVSWKFELQVIEIRGCEIFKSLVDVGLKLCK